MGTTTITTRTRMMVQDLGRPFVANVIASGTANLFDLPVESISQTASPPEVFINGVLEPPSATPTYVIDYKYGQILFSTVLAQGTTVAVQGTTYDFFDDDEVAQAVTDAFNLHVQDQDPLPTIDPIPGQTSISTTEEYLVSIMAARELLWFRTTDASQQIDIHTPEGVTIPRSERWKQMLEQISALENEYKELSLALGVGTFRLQVLNQRRVSYTTNRLVPVFREQEYNTPYSGFFPTTGAPGTQIAIYGYYFTGATAVTFGGVPATNFTINPATVPGEQDTIVATVPPGALTGQIGVTTPYGVVLSTAQFVVGQPAPFIAYGPEKVPIPIPPGL